jgi:hypothetical protein
LGVLTDCKRETIKPKELEMSKSLTVEILPGKSIGDVNLGAKADTLPSRVIITRPSGSLDGVRFLLNEGDIIEDAWIEDMRAFPHQVLYQGKRISSDISIEDLERLLGAYSGRSGHGFRRIRASKRSEATGSFQGRSKATGQRVF